MLDPRGCGCRKGEIAEGRIRVRRLQANIKPFASARKHRETRRPKKGAPTKREKVSWGKKASQGGASTKSFPEKQKYPGNLASAWTKT